MAHTLRTLMGAIPDPPLQHWATFYDIRRYGGLQIFLRAISGRGSLSLGGEGENVELPTRALRRCRDHPYIRHADPLAQGPDEPRRTPDRSRICAAVRRNCGRGRFVGLARIVSARVIEHAYASTEAGVVFAVDDGRPGFPASWIDRDGAVQMKIVDDALHVRSDRCALRFLGKNAPALTDKDGFVDTGDMVDRRGDRCYFAGRRGGIMNVGGVKIHPEEVEAALNSHAAVRASRVFARKNPITGALVFADVVLREGCAADAKSERQILSACRALLRPHSVPAGLRFVSDLPMTEGGKLARHG